jgi:aldose 1-epimerase
LLILVLVSFDMTLHTLKSPAWRLQIAPTVGASIFMLQAHNGEDWHAVLRTTPGEALDKRNPSPFSSFTLAPFSNRIRDARFTFQGRDYQLRSTSSDGNTQHGDVRGRPWTVVQADEQRLECRIDTRDFPDFNYPFPFVMSAAYRVDGNDLHTELALTNTGSEAMPAGFGLHPYFNRFLAGSGEVQLSFKAGGVYETDDTFIPTEGMKPIPTTLDFSTPRSAGEQSLNHLYGGWDGRAALEWPNSGLRIEITCDSVFSHLVVFTAPDGSLAVEPVTHATDGFNLRAKGVERTGVTVLEPGETMAGTVALTVQQ